MPHEVLLLSSTDGGDQLTAPVTGVQNKLHVVPYYWDPVGLAYVVAQQAGGGTGGGGDASAANQTTEISKLTSIDGKTPALGQALAAGSVPVVLTASQLTTLTPLSSVSVSNFPATQAVSGTVTANAGTNLNTSALALDATLTGGTQKTKLVDSGGTNVATVSAAGAVKVDGSAVTQPVSGTFWQTTQPVSLATNTPDVTDRSGRLLGIVSNANIDVLLSTRLKPADTLAGVTTVGAVTSITNAVTVAQATAANLNATTTPATPAASANTHVNVSLGSSTGKTVVMKTGALASSAVTADQVILTYTVTSGKTFYLEYVSINARLTTFAATATNFGTVSLENPSGTKIYTDIAAGTGVLAEPILLYFAEPIPIASATVIRLVCTPSAATAFTWQGNFGGYER